MSASVRAVMLTLLIASQRSIAQVGARCYTGCSLAILNVPTAHSSRVHCIAAHFVAAAAALCMPVAMLLLLQCACGMRELRCHMSVASSVRPCMCVTCTCVVFYMLIRLVIRYMQVQRWRVTVLVTLLTLWVSPA
jgi:hypothetical protein